MHQQRWRSGSAANPYAYHGSKPMNFGIDTAAASCEVMTPTLPQAFRHTCFGTSRKARIVRRKTLCGGDVHTIIRTSADHRHQQSCTKETPPPSCRPWSSGSILGRLPWSRAPRFRPCSIDSMSLHFTTVTGCRKPAGMPDAVRRPKLKSVHGSSFLSAGNGISPSIPSSNFAKSYYLHMLLLIYKDLAQYIWMNS